MTLSVVVPTLDNREQLARTLDGLADHVPEAEVVVVNGPSTDGTTSPGVSPFARASPSTMVATSPLPT